MSNSIEKLAKEAERLAKNLQGNPFSVFDRIAKDIQEQKDNAIAMEFTKYIGELLRKNGVMPKIKQYGCDFYGENSFSSKYGVIIDELDFSEHDKVFEDKIAKLEEELKEWRAEAREIKKNRDEQLKSFRKAVEPYVDIGHMHETIGELKQRIAELESKETETPSDIDTSNPLACAESVIEHMTHCEKFMIMPERDVQTFSVEELKEIADYLMVYYRHHRDRDEEETISF